MWKSMMGHSGTRDGASGATFWSLPALHFHLSELSWSIGWNQFCDWKAGAHTMTSAVRSGFASSCTNGMSRGCAQCAPPQHRHPEDVWRKHLCPRSRWRCGGPVAWEQRGGWQAKASIVHAPHRFAPHRRWRAAPCSCGATRGRHLALAVIPGLTATRKAAEGLGRACPHPPPASAKRVGRKMNQQVN